MLDRKRIKYLNSVERAIIVGTPSVTAGIGFRHGVYVGLVAIACTYIARKYGGPEYGYVAALSASIFGFFIVRRFVKSQTWSAYILCQTDLYKPINESAYRRLINRAREGSLSADELRDWLGIERGMIGGGRNARVVARDL